MTALFDRNYCSALVITCSDFRFKAAERAFAEAARLGDDYDLIARPGSIRSFVQPRSAASGDSMLDEIKLLWSLHQFSRVLIVNHVSCRAYDDLASSDNEIALHGEHLRRAVPVIEALLSGVKAEPYLINYARGEFVVTKVAMSNSA